MGGMAHAGSWHKTKILATDLITSWQIDVEKMETVANFISWAPKSLQTVTAAMKSRHLFLGRKAEKARQHIKKQRHHFADKGLYSESYVFSSSHV